jgi:hypothetical protein
LKEKFGSFPDFKKTLLELKTKFIINPHLHALLLDINEQENTKESLAAALEVKVVRTYR